MRAKTTLNLDEALLRAAKRHAAERGTTLTSVVEEALRAALTEPASNRDFRLALPTVRGRRLPDVHVSDRDVLFDRMEARR